MLGAALSGACRMPRSYHQTRLRGNPGVLYGYLAIRFDLENWHRAAFRRHALIVEGGTTIRPGSLYVQAAAAAFLAGAAGIRPPVAPVGARKGRARLPARRDQPAAHPSSPVCSSPLTPGPVSMVAAKLNIYRSSASHRRAIPPMVQSQL